MRRLKCFCFRNEDACIKTEDSSEIRLRSYTVMCDDDVKKMLKARLSASASYKKLAENSIPEDTQPGCTEEHHESITEDHHESIPDINISYIDETEGDHDTNSVEERSEHAPRPLTLQLTAHWATDGGHDQNNMEDEDGYQNDAYSISESNDSNTQSIHGSVIDLRVKSNGDVPVLQRHNALTRPNRIPFYQSISRDYSQDQACALGLLPCGHLYHFNCIFEWVKIHKNCPNCRDTLQLDNIRVVHIKALEEKRRHSLESSRTLEQDINDLRLFVGEDSAIHDPKLYRRSLSVV